MNFGAEPDIPPSPGGNFASTINFGAESDIPPPPEENFTPAMNFGAEPGNPPPPEEYFTPTMKPRALQDNPPPPEFPGSKTRNGQRGNTTLVIRWQGGTDEKALAPLRSALAYFPGDSRVRVYLERETRLLEPLSHGVYLDRETLALLSDRFGVENISVF